MEYNSRALRLVSSAIVRSKTAGKVALDHIHLLHVLRLHHGEKVPSPCFQSDQDSISWSQVVGLYTPGFCTKVRNKSVRRKASVVFRTAAAAREALTQQNCLHTSR